MKIQHEKNGTEKFEVAFDEQKFETQLGRKKNKMSQKTVTGSLSSRVMNMKFMRFNKNTENDSDDTNRTNSNSEDTSNSRDASNGNPDMADSQSSNSSTKFRDNSEWSLSGQNDMFSGDKGQVKTVVKKRKIIRLAKPRRLIKENVSVTTLNRDNMNVAGKIKFENVSGKKRAREDGDHGEEKKITQDNEENKDENNDDYDLDRIFKETKNKTTPNKNSKKKKEKKKKRKNK